MKLGALCPGQVLYDTRYGWKVEVVRVNLESRLVEAQVNGQPTRKFGGSSYRHWIPIREAGHV